MTATSEALAANSSSCAARRAKYASSDTGSTLLALVLRTEEAVSDGLAGTGSSSAAMATQPGPCSLFVASGEMTGFHLEQRIEEVGEATYPVGPADERISLDMA